MTETLFSTHHNGEWIGIRSADGGADRPFSRRYFLEEYGGDSGTLPEHQRRNHTESAVQK